MQPFPQHEHRSPKPLAQRLDRAFADVNAFLLALAIGLAMLDIACFAATRSTEMIKPLLRVTQTAPLSECGAAADDKRPSVGLLPIDRLIPDGNNR